MNILTSRRSDPTRAAILTAARDRFAADGFERATIRAIAADADVDPAMVMRYYGSKEKLFAAAANFDLRLPDLTGLAESEYGATLVRHLLHRWESDGTFLALLRAAVTNDAARERMGDIFTAQVTPLVVKVCPAPEEAPTRAALFTGQMLGLALCRYVLRLSPIVALSADEAAGWIGPIVQRYLTGNRG